MFMMHIALQGCLRGRHVEYGVTADTGGHIKYLLDLARSCAVRGDVARIDLVTRAFSHPDLDAIYSQPFERICEKTRIVRLPTTNSGYLSKEALYPELGSFISALAVYIAALDAKPDIIHAHYADAGLVAYEISRMTGIPYFFTAHSLGAVKRATLETEAGAEHDVLAQRTSTENTAVGGAHAIIASSRDEAELQYASYPDADRGRIRVIPPGIDLSVFSGASPQAAVTRSIDRFLTDPDKPLVLALARPVRKKNLKALVHAFGRNAALRRFANLAIVAGTRENIAELEPECRDTMRELFTLIDDYDLHGSISYPKTHAPDDVPALYALARERRGLFANPALNEPFGLTLLEAAASGLPIVATDSGGPNDIVEHCRNGMLVPPRDSDNLGRVMLDLLTDGAQWDTYAANGQALVQSYDWTRHADVYLDLIREVLTPPATQIQSPETMLVCDIDNTLIGDTQAVGGFHDWHDAQSSILYGIATGRTFHGAQYLLAREGAPHPAFLIASVGTSIYIYDTARRHYVRDTQWEESLAQNWRRDAINELLAQLPYLRPQGPLENTPLKLSYFVEEGRHVTADIRKLLNAAGLEATIVQSHGHYLDILPLKASKGTACDYVRRKLGLQSDQVIVAGDSGNDTEMLRSFKNAIIVGNFSDNIAHLPELSHCYVARGRHATAVLEGVDYFRCLHKSRNDLSRQKAISKPMNVQISEAPANVSKPSSRRV